MSLSSQSSELLSYCWTTQEEQQLIELLKTQKSFDKVIHGLPSRKPEQVQSYLKKVLKIINKELQNHNYKRLDKKNTRQCFSALSTWLTSSNSSKNQVIHEISKNLLLSCNEKQKFLLKLIPFDDEIARALKEFGYNPNLELTVKSSKTINDVLLHLRQKWVSENLNDNENTINSNKDKFVFNSPLILHYVDTHSLCPVEMSWDSETGETTIGEIISKHSLQLHQSDCLILAYRTQFPIHSSHSYFVDEHHDSQHSNDGVFTPQSKSDPNNLETISTFKNSIKSPYSLPFTLDFSSSSNNNSNNNNTNENNSNTSQFLIPHSYWTNQNSHLQENHWNGNDSILSLGSLFDGNVNLSRLSFGSLPGQDEMTHLLDQASSVISSSEPLITTTPNFFEGSLLKNITDSESSFTTKVFKEENFGKRKRGNSLGETSITENNNSSKRYSVTK